VRAAGYGLPLSVVALDDRSEGSAQRRGKAAPPVANQTTKATEEIAGQVSGMRQATDEAVNAITHIAATIDEVSKIATTIVSAVKQQNDATADISQNVQQAATRTTAVSENIGGVSQTAIRAGGAAQHVLEAAAHLSQ
jgi:methyl-accepting chemotaxis protein